MAISVINGTQQVVLGLGATFNTSILLLTVSNKAIIGKYIIGGKVTVNVPFLASFNISLRLDTISVLRVSDVINAPYFVMSESERANNAVDLYYMAMFTEPLPFNTSMNIDWELYYQNTPKQTLPFVY